MLIFSFLSLRNRNLSLTVSFLWFWFLTSKHRRNSTRLFILTDRTEPCLHSVIKPLMYSRWCNCKRRKLNPLPSVSPFSFLVERLNLFARRVSGLRPSPPFLFSVSCLRPSPLSSVFASSPGGSQGFAPLPLGRASSSLYPLPSWTPFPLQLSASLWNRNYVLSHCFLCLTVSFLSVLSPLSAAHLLLNYSVFPSDP